VLGIRPEFVNVTSAQVRPFIPTRRRVHFKDRAKVLVAPDFRRLASQLPVLGTLNGLASSTFHRLPEKTQNRIRERLQWPISVGRPRTDLTLDSRLARAQLATHYHSPNKLITRLGWKPPLSYEAGIETIGEWLKFAGMTRQEPLTRERKSALHGGVGENVAA
jgi:hypothetical protein